jgi:hypothetical protein
VPRRASGRSCSSGLPTSEFSSASTTHEVFASLTLEDNPEGYNYGEIISSNAYRSRILRRGFRHMADRGIGPKANSADESHRGIKRSVC